MLRVLYFIAISRASVYIYGPEALREELHHKHRSTHIPSSLGNFGNPRYGTTIIGGLFWPGPEEELGCGALSYIDYNQEHEDASSPILLMKRGSCSYVQKVRHAQDIGAAAVLIINTSNDVESTVMNDDGTAGNLYIPAFLISKSDGETILRYLKSENSNQVTMKLTFEIHHSGKTVDYQIWMSPEQTSIRAFLHDFASAANKMTDKVAKFTPHYRLTYCYECKQSEFTTNSPDCFGGGRYCAPDPDGPGSMTGRDVMYEDLRQLCIFKEYKDNTNSKWWEYVYNLYDTCPDFEITIECAKSAMDLSGISHDLVHNCIRNSFERKDHGLAKNTLLAAERSALNDIGLAFFPAILINNQTFRGDIEVEEVKGAICAGFKEAPDICDEWFDEKSKGSESKWGIGVKTIAFCLLGILFLLCIVVTWSTRRMRSDLHNEMKKEVIQYINVANTTRLGEDPLATKGGGDNELIKSVN